MVQSWPISYRAKPYFVRVSIVCTLFFALIGMAFTSAAYFNVDGSFARPKTAALFFGTFWSALTLLGIYLLAFSIKYRLCVDGKKLRQIGVFTDRVMDLGQVQSAKWRVWPANGSIRLESVLANLSIELGTILPNHRETLIEYLRTTIPAEKQINWDKFDRHFNARTDSETRRSTRWIGVLFLIFGLSFIVAWQAGLGGVNLIAAFVNFGLGTCLVLRSRRTSEPKP